jgi:PAS domain S-box-containing protein
MGDLFMSQNFQNNDITYRNLFETMAQGIVYQNSKGEIISVNNAAESILGLTYDQMTGRTSMDPRWKSVHENGSDFDINAVE